MQLFPSSRIRLFYLLSGLAWLMGLSLIHASVYGQTQVNPQDHLPSLHFFNPTIDFGRSSASTHIIVSYYYQNQGSESVLIQTVKCSCGCMSPSYDKDSILPGEIGFIQVLYQPSGYGGKIHKSTTFVLKDGQRGLLRLKGELLPDSIFDPGPLAALLSPKTIKVPDLRIHELRSFEIPYHNRSEVTQFIHFEKDVNGSSDLQLGIFKLPENMSRFQPKRIRSGYRVLIPPGQKGHLTLLLRTQAALPSDFSYTFLFQSLLSDSEVEIEIKGNFIAP